MSNATPATGTELLPLDDVECSTDIAPYLPEFFKALEISLLEAAPSPSVAATAQRTPIIRASNDREAAARFLLEYQDSPHTLRAYKRETLRLLMWCEAIALKSFSDLVREDVDDYFAFLSAPPADWISPGRHEVGSPEWRPFRGPLKGSSLRYVKLVCDSLFSYLVEAHYLAANPFSLARKRTREASTDEPIAPPTARRHQLPDDALQLAYEWINALSDKTPSQRCRKMRFRATLSLFLFTGGRLSEIASANTQNLAHEKGRWTLWVIGKGGKKAGLPLPPTLVRDLTEYRLANGLPAYPTMGERNPLLSKLLQPSEGISDNMVYREVKAILKGAGEIAHERGRDDLEHLLKHSSTHWLRHTTIGATVEATQDLQLAQQLGRHSSVTTTSIYSTLADEQFHDKVSETLEGVFGSL